MKKLFLLPLAVITFLFTACLEVEPEVVADRVTFGPIAMTPSIPFYYENVEIEATLFLGLYAVTSVAVEWRIGNASQADIPMELDRTQGIRMFYRATLGQQPMGTTAYWRIVATKENGVTERTDEQPVTWIGDAIGPGEPDALARQLLIFSAFGSGEGGGDGGNRSFVELFNTTDQEIDLEGITLYWANGHRGVNVTEDDPWNLLPLTGTIPASGSFLILGPLRGSGGTLQFAEGDGDMNPDDFVLSNRSFKVALIRSSEPLLQQNPFNMDGQGAVAEGYIDLLGAANNINHADPDRIFGSEGSPARNSGSEGVRRNSLIDTDYNRGITDHANTGDGPGDFNSIRWNGMSESDITEFRPRRASDGSWTPTFWTP